MTVDLRTTTGQVEWPRDFVAVTGADAHSFLQGQLSQELEGLADGGAVWSWLLQPQGKVDALVRVTRAGDGYVIDTDAGWGDVVVTRLRRFLLRVKVVVEPVAGTCIAVRGAGAIDAAGGAGVDAGWPGIEGVDMLGPEVAVIDGVAVAGPDDLEAVRIEAGFPAMGRELDADTIPAEAGQWLIDRTVSFAKGCFTGQELVARIDSRGGNVPRPIRGVVFEGGEVPAAGAAVSAGGRDVGRITSAAKSVSLGAPVALAIVARTVEIGAAVDVAGQAARIAALPLVS